MDDACDRLVNAQAAMRQVCDDFDVLVADPASTPAQLAQFQHLVRTTGMKVMALTSEYLSALNAFMSARNPGG